MKKALLIISQEGYQDIELDGTRKGLLEGGFEIIICSEEIGTCNGKFGGIEEAVIAIRDVIVPEYDLIAFIGGPGAAKLASNGNALNIAYRAAQSQITLGAICIAPTILAKAKILSGKKATVWDNNGKQISLLEKNGASYTGDDVTVDGNIVTANGPEAAEEFGRTLATV